MTQTRDDVTGAMHIAQDALSRAADGWEDNIPYTVRQLSMAADAVHCALALVRILTPEDRPDHLPSPLYPDGRPNWVCYIAGDGRACIAWGDNRLAGYRAEPLG